MKDSKRRNTSGFILLFEAVLVVLVFALTLTISGGTGALSGIISFVDVPSLVLLLLFIVPVLFAAGMEKDFAKVFSVGKKPCSLAQMKKTLEAIRMMQKLVLCGAVLVMMIEVMMILRMMTDIAVFGANLSVAVLVVIYAVIIESFLIPLGACVQNHITDALDVAEGELPAIEMADKDEEV